MTDRLNLAESKIRLARAVEDVEFYGARLARGHNSDTDLRMYKDAKARLDWWADLTMVLAKADALLIDFGGPAAKPGAAGEELRARAPNPSIQTSDSRGT